MRWVPICFLLFGALLIIPQAYAVDNVIEEYGDSYGLTYFFGTDKRDGGTLNMSGDHEFQIELNLDNDENDLDTVRLQFTIDQDRSGSLNVSGLQIHVEGISALSDTALAGDITAGGRLRPDGRFRLVFGGQEVSLGGNHFELHIVLRGRARVGRNGDVIVTANAAGDIDVSEILAPEVVDIHHGELGGSSVVTSATSTSLQWFLFLQAFIGNGDDWVAEGGIGYGADYNYLPGDCCYRDNIPSFRTKRNGKLVSSRIPFQESGWVIVELNPDLTLNRMRGNVNGRPVNYRWRRARRR